MTLTCCSDKSNPELETIYSTLKEAHWLLSFHVENDDDEKKHGTVSSIFAIHMYLPAYVIKLLALLLCIQVEIVYLLLFQALWSTHDNCHLNLMLQVTYSGQKIHNILNFHKFYFWVSSSESVTKFLISFPQFEKF